MARRTVAAVLLLLASTKSAHALRAYGHAYSRPNDFTPEQFRDVASRFEVFTVEKAQAAAVYGNASARPPFATNSIAATVGTARKIKSINASVKVLMYWNSALHFNFYECESEVQPSWIFPNPDKSRGPPFYNYSVPAFREWWVRCAVTAVTSSGGAIDGLFLDATPKLEARDAVPAWGAMVTQIRNALPRDAFVVNNGFYLGASGSELAGEDAWNFTDNTYVESLTRIGKPPMTPADGSTYLRWLANASAAHPDRLLVGHGNISPEDPSGELFHFSLAKYLLVTSSVADGYFLANNGSYSIDGGLLDQPASVYGGGDGLRCGEPMGSLTPAPRGRPGSHVFRRRFEHGTVEVDLDAATASIQCGGAVLMGRAIGGG